MSGDDDDTSATISRLHAYRFDNLEAVINRDGSVTLYVLRAHGAATHAGSAEAVTLTGDSATQLAAALEASGQVL